MPYIATDLDAFDSAQGVAGATALPLQHVLGGLALLWRWCWRQKTDAVTADQLAAHFGSTVAGLAAALVAFGFLETRGGAYRVRGAARYLHITAVRTAAGKARAAGAKRGARGQLLTSTPPAHTGGPASTPPAAGQHATSLSATSDERRATSEQKSLAGSATAAPRAPADPPEGADNTYKALVQALFVLFRESRGYDLEPSDKDWRVLQRLRAKHEGSEIIRRWGHGVKAKFKAKCSSFTDLEAKWNDCGAPEASGGAVAKPRTADEVMGFPSRLLQDEEDEKQRKWIEHLNSRRAP